MQKIVLSLMLWCCTLLMHAFTLTGHVRTDSVAAMPYVSVCIPDLKVGSVTDISGNYRLANVPAGRHTVLVSYVGYATQTVIVNIDKDTRQDFVLKELTLTLGEVFVTPNGESLQRFILNQTVKHRRKLAKIVDHYELRMDMQMEQRGQDFSFLLDGFRKTLNFVLGLMGYRTFFNYVLDNPSFHLEAVFDTQYDKGKMKTLSRNIGHCTPPLDEKQKKSFMKVLGRVHSDGHEYDKMYDKIAELKQSLDKKFKKNPADAEKDLKYAGAYEENGRTIHVLSTSRKDYHIVDNIWQVRRITYYDRKRKKELGVVEFAELGKNVFMPISIFASIDFDLKDIVKRQLDEERAKVNSTKSSKKQKKSRERIAKLEQLQKSSPIFGKIGVGYTYKHFRLKPQGR